MKLKFFIVGVLAAMLIGGIIFSTTHAAQSDKQATQIPIGSTSAVAKQHSQGAQPACLTKNTNADKAVRRDDFLIDGKYSAFDLATTMGIIDVPAGTKVDQLIHSYNGKIVTGSIAYPSKYGSYNFTVVPSSKSVPYHQWTMTSLVACRA